MSRPLSPEDVARLPLPGMAVPSEIAFSPDQRVLTYLHSPEATLDLRLFVFDLDRERHGGNPLPRQVDLGAAVTSEADLDPAERLHRERRRQTGLGITSACWAASADALVVPLPDGLRVVTGLAADPEAPRCELAVPASDLGAPIVGARLSPDGRSLAFSAGGELCVAASTAGTAARRLTESGAGGLTNGVAEYVAEEEMGREAGLWWSPDSAFLAYAEVDERHIPEYRIVRQGADRTGPGTEEIHRYPFAGEANAVVRLGVVPAGGGATCWLDTGDPDQYLARVTWLADGRLVAQLESRDQTALRVVAYDPKGGASELLWTEHGEPWINLHDDFRQLDDGSFVWSSERSGYRHLELRAPSGELLRPLTAGEWQVDAIEGIDDRTAGGDGATLYFSGRAESPLERHLYAVDLAGGSPRRLTPERGWHVSVVAPARRLFVDRHGALDRPPSVLVRFLEDASILARLHDGRDRRIDDLGLEPPQLVTLPASDGTPLYGLLYRPPGDPLPAAPGGEPAGGGGAGAGTAPPLVLEVYGGPRAQRVIDDWAPTVRLHAQALRRLGCAVLCVDNRGSAGRGIDFERPIWHRLGEAEVADQLAAVDWAVARHLADPGRLAVYGWSYGGYMAVRLLEQAPEVFAAGVAGAPVTDFGGYDTHYTERYLGRPQQHPDAYTRSSVLADTAAITGRLLLVHGLIDENVHFRHTARLVQRLIASRRRHELLLFPEERHLPRDEADREFLEEQVTAWLLAALGMA